MICIKFTRLSLYPIVSVFVMAKCNITWNPIYTRLLVHQYDHSSKAIKRLRRAWIVMGWVAIFLVFSVPSSPPSPSARTSLYMDRKLPHFHFLRLWGDNLGPFVWIFRTLKLQSSHYDVSNEGSKIILKWVNKLPKHGKLWVNYRFCLLLTGRPGARNLWTHYVKWKFLTFCGLTGSNTNP